MLACLVVIELNGKLHRFNRGVSGRFSMRDLQNGFREAGRLELYCTPQGWYLEGADGRTLLNYVTGRPMRFPTEYQALTYGLGLAKMVKNRVKVIV